MTEDHENLLVLVILFVDAAASGIAIGLLLNAGVIHLP